MKTSELKGFDLDCWVAKSLGYEHLGRIGTSKAEESENPWCLSGANDWWKESSGHLICGPCEGFPRAYSMDWEHGGPIIEREQIALVCYEHLHVLTWEAFHRADLNMDGAPISNSGRAEGSTPLIAAMRAYVASKFGDEVLDEVPA